MKKCFTINPYRTTSEFTAYEELLASQEFQGIEIFYPYVLSPADIQTYYQNVNYLLKYNPEMVLHLPYGSKNDLSNLHNYQAVIERLKQAITFGASLNVTKYTLHLGYLNNQKRDVVINHLITVLKDLCDYAGKAWIMIENMPGKGELGYSPEEIKNIILRVNKPNLKFILDTGHAHLSEYDILDYIEVLSQYLSHIHLSDNNGIRDEHAPLGTGSISFDKVFAALKDYQELYCLEIIYQDVNQLKQYSKQLSRYFL